MKTKFVSYFDALVTGLAADSDLAAQGPSGVGKSSDGVWRQNADRLLQNSRTVAEKTDEAEFYTDQHGRIFSDAENRQAQQPDRRYAELQAMILLVETRMRRRQTLMSHLRQECHCKKTLRSLERKQRADEERLSKLVRKLQKTETDDMGIVFTHDALPDTSASLRVLDGKNLN